MVLAASLPILLLMLAFALAWPAHRSLYLGFALGSSLTLTLTASLAAPEHVDRWRRGAEAEKRTARELARLVPRGWAIIHDVAERGGGNRDHIAVAPSGDVFLLDTKAHGGDLSVEPGVLRVRWLEDPDDGYERDLTPHMKAAAASLARDLSAKLGRRLWVTPVVVIWGRWAGAPHVHDGVAWVHGRDLADRLHDHAGHENPQRHDQVARAVASLDKAAAT